MIIINDRRTVMMKKIWIIDGFDDEHYILLDKDRNKTDINQQFHLNVIVMMIWMWCVFAVSLNILIYHTEDSQNC